MMGGSFGWRGRLERWARRKYVVMRVRRRVVGMVGKGERLSMSIVVDIRTNSWLPV